METYKNVSCVAPFSSLHLANKSYTCCVINSNRGIDVDPSKDLNWHFENTNKDYRLEFITAGHNISKYKDCIRCSSRRDGSQNIDHNSKANLELDYINKPQLTNLHIKFSNSCNLACRTCDPGNSSMLFKENEFFKFQSNKFGKNGLIQKIDRNSKLYKSILNSLSTLTFVWFSGGEPLLHEEVWEILEILYEQGYSKNIGFRVNTNGTIKLTDRRLEILNSFKTLEMHVSMDGFEKIAEYIRTGIVWKIWWQNLLTYKDSLKSNSIVINITISVLNIHILEQLIELFYNNKLKVATNIVFHPIQLSIINLNQQCKDYINERYKDGQLDNVLHFLNQPNNLDPIEVIKYIDTRDDYVIKNNIHRNFKSFKEVDPNWHKLLKG